MPGFLLTKASAVACSHQAVAMPQVVSPVLRASQSPVALQASPYTVTGCLNPAASGGPCATGVWTSGTTRVLSFGQPLAIQQTPGQCAPNGLPMIARTAGTKVRAT